MPCCDIHRVSVDTSGCSHKRGGSGDVFGVLPGFVFCRHAACGREKGSAKNSTVNTVV